MRCQVQVQVPSSPPSAPAGLAHLERWSRWWSRGRRFFAAVSLSSSGPSALRAALAMGLPGPRQPPAHPIARRCSGSGPGPRGGGHLAC